jgi:hypothetical protein
LGEALADLELQRGSSGVRGVVCSAGRKSTQTGDADSTFTGSLRWFTRKREVGANCVDEVTYGRSAPTRYERLIIEPQGIAGTFEIAGCTYFGQSVAATTSVTRDGKRVDITSEVKALCFSKSFQAETEVRELAEPTNLMIDGVALDEYEVAHELFADCETGN